MKVNTEWILKDSDYELAMKLSRKLGISLPAAEVYAARGLTSVEEVDAFRDMNPSQLHNPKYLPDIEPCLDRLEKAIKENELVTLWGDYDVDGVTSTTIFVECMTRFGGRVDYHVPHRMIDGYDVKRKAVDIAVKSGSKLLVTVDCGVRAFDAATYAKEKGVDLIVTDHHHPSDDGRLPDCLAVVNPSRLDSKYPFPGLVGAGVIFKVMCGLCKRFGVTIREIWDMCIELVALGTVADVGLMKGENRVMVHHGCAKLNDTTRPGIQALKDVANIKEIGPDTIGFQLGPRINAPGRIADSKDSLDLLLEKHPREAERRANGVDTQNRKRQAMLDKLMKDAHLKTANRPEGPTILVVSGKFESPDDIWHPGLVGLVAGRIAEACNVPCLAISELADGKAKGSCRSTRDYDILAALTSDEVYPLFTACGGHKFAAGFSLLQENMPKLAEALHAYAVGTMGISSKVIEVDAIADVAGLNLKTLQDLQKLAPFGNGNPEPILMSHGLIVRNVILQGKEQQHLKIELSGHDGRGKYKALMWNKAHRADELVVGGRIDVCYKLQLDDWKGHLGVQLLLEDFKSSEDTD
jgi:single-stranded-DNA-specific exonuclease